MISAASGESGSESDPACISAHHLEYHHAIVGCGRRVQPVERLGRDVDRRHKTERQFGRRQIVIDGLWHADYRKAAFVKLLGDRQRAFAAEHDQGLDTENVEIRQRLADRHFRKHRFPVDHLYKASAVSRAQDRAAAGQNAADALRRQLYRVRFAEDALEAVFDPDDIHPILADRRPDDRPDHRVQARRIAAARQYSDLLIHNRNQNLILSEKSKRWKNG